MARVPGTGSGLPMRLVFISLIGRNRPGAEEIFIGAFSARSPLLIPGILGADSYGPRPRLPRGGARGAGPVKVRPARHMAGSQGGRIRAWNWPCLLFDSVPARGGGLFGLVIRRSRLREVIYQGYLPALELAAVETEPRPPHYSSLGRDTDIMTVALT
jgi:hypothetical protein